MTLSFGQRILSSVPSIVEIFRIPAAHAQPAALFPPQVCDFKFGNIHFDCIPAYISMLTSVVISFTVSISLVMLMWNGFKFMIGPATFESSDAAKKGIINALLGLAVSLLTYIIIETVVVHLTS